MKRFIKLFSGSVVCLYGVGCLALSNPDQVQAFIRDTVIDWAAFAAEASTLLNVL